MRRLGSWPVESADMVRNVAAAAVRRMLQIAIGVGVSYKTIANTSSIMNSKRGSSGRQISSATRSNVSRVNLALKRPTRFLALCFDFTTSTEQNAV